MKNTRILLLLVFHLYVTHGNDSCVQTDEGIFIGKGIWTQSGRPIYAFTGIAYAESPSGNLRFQDPAPKKRWNGTMSAQKAGNVCIQINRENEIIVDEDCLVLNVYTPKLHSIWKSLLPVMVYIHGGAFISGEGGPNEYSLRYLLDRADIILVTMNYRLGVFGFFSTGDSIAPGNFGLKDQRLALQWVRRNIHDFGDNSNRITLFGQSAGAGSVSLHALSESSQPYFQQYIMQSGFPVAPWSYTTNPRYFDYWSLIATKLNCTTANTRTAVECLRQQPSTELFKASNRVGVETGIGFCPSIEPKYENAFLTDVPAILLKQGKLKDGPVITGTVNDDGLILSTGYYADVTMYKALRIDPEKEIRPVLNAYQPIQLKNDTELAAQCKRFYLGKTLPSDRKTLLKRFTEFVSDYQFFYAFTLTRDALRNGNHSIYIYLYDFVGRLSGTQLETHNDDAIGVAHGDELYYLLDWKETFDSRLSRHRTKAENRNTHLLVDFWTIFAMNGEPKSKLLRDSGMWIDASCEETYIQIGDGRRPVVTVKNHFIERRIKFWRMIAPEFPL